MRFRIRYVALVLLASCALEAESGWTNEDVGGATSALAKGLGGTNGDPDYCTNPEMPCGVGESDCDSDAECQTGLVCGVDNGSYFGFGERYDVCVVPHCNNNILDADEEFTDCGGADCGSNCSSFCTSLPPDGDPNRCSTDCKCPAQIGDCDSQSECQTGLVCGLDNGNQFGWDTLVDVCVETHCTNGVQDADETSIDCGGVDCGSFCGADCSGQPGNGAGNHCSSECPCPAGEGDCDSDAECTTGNVCTTDTGAAFGFDPLVDMCLASTCDNGVQDGDETGIDCGPSCIPCGGSSVFLAQHGLSDQDNARSVGVDGFGNTVVAGTFRGTTNLGGADLTRAGTSTTATDVFVAKYAPDGSHIWSFRYGAEFADGDYAVAVAVAPNGTVALTGNFYLTVDFGDGPRTAVGGADAFVLVLNANGTFRWARTIGSTGVDVGRDITFTPSGGVVVTGSFEGAADFGGAAALTSAGASDIFIARYNGSNGSYQVARRFGGVGADAGRGVAMDANYNLYLAAEATGDVTYGSVPTIGRGGFDAVVGRFNFSTLLPVWIRHYGDVSHDRAIDVTADGAGNVTAVGSFQRTIDFGGGPVTFTGATDVFVVNLAVDGTYQWSSAFGGTGSDTPLAVAASSNTNEVTVAGAVTGNVSNFPGGASTGFGSVDGFLVRYSSSGTVISSERHGGAGVDIVAGADVSSASLSYAGYFEGTATIAGQSLTSAGDRDVFVARLVP